MTWRLQTDTTVGDVVQAILPLWLGVGAVVVLSYLFGSGRAKMCKPHGTLRQDHEGRVIREVSIPVCTDLDNPNENCCAVYDTP